MATSTKALSGDERRASTYAYDAQDRLVSITPPSGGAISFTLDALGRHWTRSVGGNVTDTCGYVGASEAIVRITQPAGSVSAAIDALGNRAATSTSAGGFGWLLPDLHGDVAGAFTSSGSAISDSFRYSAYGTTLAKTTSSLPSPWRFQGRLALNTDDGTGANTDLYDFVVRAYDPNLAAFTSLDSVPGGAQNPLTLNRFVYALARPTTLIDPTGHYATLGDDASPFAYTRSSGSANTTTSYRPQSVTPSIQREQFREQQAMQQAARENHEARDTGAVANGIDPYFIVTTALDGAQKGLTDLGGAIIAEGWTKAEAIRDQFTSTTSRIPGWAGLVDGWNRTKLNAKAGWVEGVARLKGVATQFLGKALGAIGTGISTVTGVSDQWGQDADRGVESRVLRAGIRGVFRGGGSLIGAFGGGVAGGAACSYTVAGIPVCAAGGAAAGGFVGSGLGDAAADFTMGGIDRVSEVFDTGRHTISDSFDTVLSWFQ